MATPSDTGLRFGIHTIQTWTWPELRDRWTWFEQLGFDSLWLPDHFFPTAGRDKPMFEARITRSNSKDQGSSFDGQKKPGRKTIKQHRDENAQKGIALGLQHPIESYIQATKDQEVSSKDKGGRAPSRNIGLK